MQGHLRATFDERSLAIADRLQDWDVLGVYADEDRPEDDEEYDDLVRPLRVWLEKGATPTQLSVRLVRILGAEYGLNYTDDLAELELTRSLHELWHSLGASRASH